MKYLLNKKKPRTIHSKNYKIKYHTNPLYCHIALSIISLQNNKRVSELIREIEQLKEIKTEIVTLKVLGKKSKLWALIKKLRNYGY